MKRNRFSQTYNYPTLWGYHEESLMFSSIWNERPHVSFISGVPITNPGPENFAHVLAKGLNQYPNFRFNPENVVLVTYEEHFIIDSGSQHSREMYCKRVGSADFSAFELLKSKLVREYESTNWNK